MRMKQEKGEAKEFQKNFEQILQSIHPSYQRNTNVKGIRTEFLRELEPGVFVSQSTLCKRGTYYHCFALTLSKEILGSSLFSPFVAGVRCDHSYDITNSLTKVTGEHILLSCSHSYRKGWDGIAERCAKRAEEELLPFYQNVFYRSKIALKQLLYFSTREDVDWRMRCELIRENKKNFDFDMVGFCYAYEEAEDKEEFLLDVVAFKYDLFSQLNQESLIAIN